MANRVISIEIGYTTTQLIETDYKVKNPRVYKSVIIPTPEGVVDDGYINGEIEFAPILKQALSQYKFKAKQAVCTITSSKIATREVMLPPVKNNQVQPMVEANAGDYFPINLSEYELGHLVLGNVKEGEAYKLKVLVMACPKTLIEGYSRLCDMAGLHLVSVDYSGNSIYQVMKNETTEDTEMIIRVDEKASIATIISGASMVMQRNVMYGFDNAVYTMMNSLAFPQKTFEDAFEEFVRNECINLTLNSDIQNVKQGENSDTQNDDDYAMARLGRLNGVVSASGMSAGGTNVSPSSPIGAAKREITDSLAPLIGNVSRVLDLYNSKNADKPIKKVTLIGRGSYINGLDKLFSNELGITCVPLTLFKQIAQKDSPAMLITACGAALAPIGFISEEKKKTEAKGKTNYTMLTVLIGVLFLVVIAAMSVICYSRYFEQITKQKILQKKETEYAPYEVLFNRHEKVKQFYEEVVKDDALTYSENDNLLAFLDSLEKALPAEGSKVRDFSSSTTECILTVEFTDLDTAIGFVQQVRKFDCTLDVVLNSLVAEEPEEDEEEAVTEEGQASSDNAEAQNDEAENAGSEEAEAEPEIVYVVNISVVYFDSIKEADD